MNIQPSSNINPPPQALEENNHFFKENFNEVFEDLSLDQRITEIEEEHTQLHASINRQIKDAMQVKYSSIFTTYAQELMTNIDILITALKKSKSKRLKDTIYQIINELDEAVFPTQINYLKKELNKINN